MLTVSTLFLLRQTQRESTSGRRFERLVNSVPLWLQILTVLLITWLLVQPRYIKAKSTQRIAIVLDSSASMLVFKENTLPAIKKEITRLQGNAANAEIWILESDPAKPKIYQGSSPEEIAQAYQQWTPNSGATDPSHTLRIARSLVGAEGAVSYMTDSPVGYTLPYHASYIATGNPTPNCGITGVSFETRDGKLIWKAIIRNYSDTPQQRSWHLESPGAKTSSRTIKLDPGKITTLQGAFPDNTPRCQLVLSTDTFPLDDTLPMVRPAPKPLTIATTLPPSSVKISDRITNSFPNMRAAKDKASADLILTSTETTPSQHHLIVLPEDKTPTRPYLTGPIVATKHPLTQGLNWQTLLVRQSISLPHNTTDEVLLWQGTRALIYLRTNPNSGNKALIFNFDITRSNALKQPAAAVLLLRFCEQLRQQKIAPETLITETSEPLKITRKTGEKAPPLTIEQLSLDGAITGSTQVAATTTDLQAPDKPGFFTLRQGETTLLTAATFFADTREADFSQCAQDDLPASVPASAVDRHTRDDHLWRVWTCLTLAAITGAWCFTRPAQANKLQQES